MDLANYKFLLKDIRLWIGLFFLLRLYGITNPPLDKAHNWRQVTTNMYARNFLEIDNNILYARVDMAGELTGITAKEFPVFNYLIYGMSEIFGYQHWYGRLINLIVSCFGLWFFFRIIKDYFDDKTAFLSTMVLIPSIWLVYSRMIIPDTFAVSLVFIGLYYGLRFLRERNHWDLLWYFTFATLGSMAKIPAAFVLCVLAFPFFQKSTSWNTRLLFTLPSVALIVLNVVWYGYWVPHLVKTYGFEHHHFNSFSEGWKQVIETLPGIAHRFYFSAFHSIIAFGAFLAGIYLTIKSGKSWWKWMTFMLTVVFIIVIIKAGRTFSVHNYYIVPFVPVMALIAATALKEIKKSWIQTALLCILFLEGILNQMHNFWIVDSELFKEDFEMIADKFSSKDDLFITNGNHNPQMIYFLHRKGWSLLDEQVLDYEYMKSLSQLGAKYILVLRNTEKNNELIQMKYPVVHSDDNIIIYRNRLD